MMTLPKLIPGALPQEVTETNIGAELMQLIVIRTRVSTEKSSRDVFRFFQPDGTLVAIHDPSRERDWHK